MLAAEKLIVLRKTKAVLADDLLKLRSWRDKTVLDKKVEILLKDRLRYATQRG